MALDTEMNIYGVRTTAAQAAVTGPAMQHDCSNDESGLVLPQLKVEASWDSHGLRELADITVVTQMSPGRCVKLGIRARHLLQMLIKQAASSPVSTRNCKAGLGPGRILEGWHALASPITRAPESVADRQSNLAELCGVWSGVIAVAVYIPLLGGQLVPEAGLQRGTTVPDVIAHLAAFHKLMDTQGETSLLSSRAALTAASSPAGILTNAAARFTLPHSRDFARAALWLAD